MEKQRFQTISRQTPRLESVQKAIGAGTYTDDLRMPDMAYAELIRCPYSHARVIAIDASQAEKIPAFSALRRRRTRRRHFITAPATRRRRFS